MNTHKTQRDKPIRNRALSLSLLICIAITIVVDAIGQTSDRKVVTGLTAHRGYSAAYPENTLPAFEAGIALGVDWVELDIHQTKDGQLVVIHDKTTKRTGDSNLIVADVTYDELLKVDVATDFRKRKGFSYAQCPAQQIPLLKDVLELFITQRRTRLSIQPKVDCVADAITLVKQLGATAIVGFNDGNLKLMSTVKNLAPEIPVFWDRPPATDIDEDIEIALEMGFESIVINYAGVTSEKIAKVKSAQMQVGAWTVNDRSTLEYLVGIGIDRIYTDDPALLINIKKGD